MVENPGILPKDLVLPPETVIFGLQEKEVRRGLITPATDSALHVITLDRDGDSLKASYFDVSNPCNPGSPYTRMIVGMAITSWIRWHEISEDDPSFPSNWATGAGVVSFDHRWTKEVPPEGLEVPIDFWESGPAPERKPHPTIIKILR